MTNDDTLPDPDGIRAVYDSRAEIFDQQRPRTLMERGWLERFARYLPEGAAVLDLGCGAGEPMAAWLMDQGYAVTGIDFSEAMLALARTRWPDGTWISQDMRALELHQRFDGILAWDSFFHLTQADQRATMARIAAHLKPGGVVLTTVGPRQGEVGGCVGGLPVFHASLSPAGYAKLLEDNALRLVAFVVEDPEVDLHSVLLAQKESP